MCRTLAIKCSSPPAAQQHANAHHSAKNRKDQLDRRSATLLLAGALFRWRWHITWWGNILLTPGVCRYRVIRLGWITGLGWRQKVSQVRKTILLKTCRLLLTSLLRLRQRGTQILKCFGLWKHVDLVFKLPHKSTTRSTLFTVIFVT